MFNPVMDDSWLTVAQIADRMKLKPVTVRSWLNNGRLRGEKAGLRQWRVDPAELRRFLGESDGSTIQGSPRNDQLANELADDMDSSGEPSFDFSASISRRER